jgi:UV DNA damage repair endonuclease
MKRIGFACKWIDHADQVNGIKKDDDAKQYNTGTTTISWLNRQSKDVAEQRLWDLMVQNIAATQKLVDRVGELDENLRMVRISSDILPAYTQSDWSYFWRRPDVISYLERNFILVGNSARASNTRLSMHPGQFVVLASINEGIVQRSIEEFEYHADMARYMGYGKSFQDFKINVHISGKQGPEGIRSAYKRLTPEARNCITIENEENSWGLDDCLDISDIVPIVLDIHHHWIRSGEYLNPNDDRVVRVVDSWRGLRPVCHYSISREDYLVGHDTSVIPDYLALLESGHKKQKLRAHSDFYWNTATNEWALSFLKTHDIMCESKGKNLASFALYEQAKELTLL